MNANKQELIVAKQQHPPQQKGVVEKLLGTLGLHKTVPEMLQDAAVNNTPLNVSIEQGDGALRISHKPKTASERREISIKIESDN